MRDNSLNTFHIANDLGNYEAARNAFFVFYVPAAQLYNLYTVDTNPDTAVDASADNGGKYNSQAASDGIRLNVVKAKVPNFTLETHEYKRGNDTVKFASTPTFADGSITVDDVVGINTKDMLYSWLYLAYNPITRKGGRMSEYKKECILIEYTQDYVPIRKWTMQGCFITGIEEGDFDRENDDKRQLSVTIAYDRALMSKNVTDAADDDATE